MTYSNKKLLPFWAIILLDIFALGIALVIFSLFHHVFPKPGGSAKLNIVNFEQSAQAQTHNSEPQGESKNYAKSIGDFSEQFPKEDTGINAMKSFQNENTRIAITEVQSNDVTYYIADIWVKNIQSFKTAFAKDQYGQGIHQETVSMANKNNAIVAISGDYYGARARGIVIRQGNLYRDSLLEDVCVLYKDGVMETYTKEEFNIDDTINRGAYQAWSFGPQLLEHGQPMAEFNSSVPTANPRSAIGYYSPGHYCFVTVDGRQPGYSKGMTLKELSQLFYDLGCTAAYNLDGGQTAMMVFENALVNQPYKGGRQSSDIIYISK